MPDIKGDGKGLDVFYGLSAVDPMERKRSGMSLLNKLCALNKSDKEAFTRMVEYTLGRLIRAHSSSNLQTRGYMFTALSAILRTCMGIENEIFIGLLEKNLAVQKEDTRNNKLNKRIAAILTCGALLHSRDIKAFEKETIGDLVRRMSQNAATKDIFLEYATPFFVELFEKVNKQLKRKKKEKLFNGFILPAMEPFITKMKLPQNQFIHLRISLALHSAKIGGDDFENFLRDQDTVVKTIMSSDLMDSKELGCLFAYYSNTDPVTIDNFWTIFTESLSSSNFNLLCGLIEVCSKNFSITAALNEKVLNSLYYTIKSVRMREHKAKAVATMTTIIKWITSSPHVLKCPEDRLTAIQRLFSGDQHILHQYKELATALRYMLTSLNEADLEELTSLCLKLIDNEKASTRLCVTVVNFLGKIGQNGKLSAAAKAEIVKKVITLGRRRAIAEASNQIDSTESEQKQQPKDENDTEGNDSQEVQPDDVDDVLANAEKAAFRSIISSTYNTDFMDAILNSEEIMDELKPKEPSHEWKEAVKKTRKLQKLGKKDPYLHYVIGTYTLYLHLDATAALPAIDELIELCANRKNPADSKENAEIIVKLVLSKVLREQQPMINYQQLFTRLLTKDLISEDTINSMADAIEISTEESDEDEDEADSESDDEDGDEVGENGEQDDDEEEDSEEENDSEGEDEDKTELTTFAGTSRPANADEDSDASMDLDDAPEEDLKRLDMILAHAARKRSTEASDKEEQYTMRVKRLLKSVVKRKKSTPLGEILKKKMKLV